MQRLVLPVLRLRIARAWWLLFLIALVPAPARPAASASRAPYLILFNGRIFTADPARLHAEALAIRGERITAVGSNATVKRLADAHTRLVDLGGRTVIPGLNDAHAHLGIWPADEVFVDTAGYDPGWPELREALRKAEAQAPMGAILSGTIGTTIFYDPAIDRAALDAAMPDHPVVLGTFDSHAVILNSAALRKLGIGEDVADPASGRFERDGKGRLTGVAREYAAWGVVGRRLGAATSDGDAAAALGTQLDRAARYGITSIQDMPTDADADRTVRLLVMVPTRIRVRVTRMNPTGPAGPDYREEASASARLLPLIAVTGTKWVLDGVVFEGTLTPRQNAAVSAATAGGPYGFAGLPPLFTPSVLEAMLRDSLRHDYQLQFHVFGRPAAAELLDALERTGGRRTWARRRLRIEHGDGLTPDLIARAKAYGLIVSQQGTHLGIAQIDPGLDARFLDRLRADKAQPLRSLLAAGIPLALGSDGPLNPWLGVLGAVAHPDRPDEAITREQALIAYTYGSAYAEFAEKDKGTLMPGKLADLAVLSQDIFAVPPDALPKTRSMLTLVGGRVVSDADALNRQSKR
ncbi:MAG: amidohydrolase [Sphingomonas bacterium]